MESKVKDILKNEYIKFFIYLIIAFIIFSPSFLNLNYFWDDERFIFMNPDFLNAPSWTSFWIPGTSFHKSWPLGYTIFWFFIKIVPSSFFIFFKSLNIFFHALNSFLTYRFVKKISLPYPFLISLLFLIHPLHVESVSWIFQLLTIISYTFFILCLIKFYKFLESGFHKHILLCLFFFTCSLLTKSIAILAPFLFLILMIIHKCKLNKYLFLMPFFLVSLYVGLVNGRGTNTLLNQRQDTSITNKILDNINLIFSPVTEVHPIAKSDNAYFDYIYKRRLDKNPIQFKRSEIFSQGIWYYSASLLLPLNLQYIHKSEEPNTILVIIGLFLLILLPIFLAKKYKDNFFLHLPFFSFTLLLPYLGVSYITFFYWSNISDRYTYFFILVLILNVGLIIRHNKSYYAPFFIGGYIILLATLNLNYGFKFNNNIALYSEILTYKSHPGIYSLLIEQHLLKLDYENAQRVLDEGIQKFPNDEKLRIDFIRVENLKKYYKQL